MNRRAFLVGLVLAVLTTLLVAIYLRRIESETSGGPRVPVVVVLKDVEPGKMITEEMLGIREVPRAYVETRAVKAQEKSKILGVRTVNALAPQQQLMWTDLAVASESRGIQVPVGYRGVTIRLPADDASSVLIKPGDFVDVFAVHGKETRKSTLLLQRVLVLAVGQDTTGEVRADGRPAGRSPVITASLSVRDAQLLALASDRARIVVAMRPESDGTVLENVPDLPSKIFDEPAPAPRPLAPSVATPTFDPRRNG